MSNEYLSDRLDSAISNLIEQTVGTKENFTDAVEQALKKASANSPRGIVLDKADYCLSFAMENDSPQYPFYITLTQDGNDGLTRAIFEYGKESGEIRSALFQSNEAADVHFNKEPLWSAGFHMNKRFMYSLDVTYESRHNFIVRETIEKKVDKKAISHETYKNFRLAESNYDHSFENKPFPLNLLGKFGISLGSEIVKPIIRHPLPFGVQDLSLVKTKG